MWPAHIIAVVPIIAGEVDLPLLKLLGRSLSASGA